MLTIVNYINYTCNKINYDDSDEDDNVNNKVSDDSDEDDDNVNDEDSINKIDDHIEGCYNNEGCDNEYLKYIDNAGKYSISD